MHLTHECLSDISFSQIFFEDKIMATITHRLHESGTMLAAFLHLYVFDNSLTCLSVSLLSLPNFS